ncbi:nucleotidyl transferase AbiEii/AbiGii toxin family protein [candidate division KSB1 bacterium]|nr:nucleotidyl transferase AbiEii/AbiGii toxin family protein [candidate division KSB1 bacterium]
MISAIKRVAHALRDLNDRVVYVGGAVIGLYIDDPGAPEVCPTKDIDLVVKIGSSIELETLRQQLSHRGIHVAQDESVLCRFRYHDLLIDILSTTAIQWAPSNVWFKCGFEKAQWGSIDGFRIRILSFPYFLASKFSAFLDRGVDARTSPDFEDIVYLLDNRKNLQEILESDNKVRSFLCEQLVFLLDEANLQEGVLAHLEPASQSFRYDLLMRKIKDLES